MVFRHTWPGQSIIHYVVADPEPPSHLRYVPQCLKQTYATFCQGWDANVTAMIINLNAKDTVNESYMVCVLMVTSSYYNIHDCAARYLISEVLSFH